MPQWLRLSANIPSTWLRLHISPFRKRKKKHKAVGTVINNFTEVNAEIRHHIAWLLGTNWQPDMSSTHWPKPRLLRNGKQEKQYDHLLKWHVGPIPKVKYT